MESSAGFSQIPAGNGDQAPEGCRFPVGWDEQDGDFALCGRATTAVNSVDGRGRPTGYCDDPAHTRQRANAARRAIRRSLPGQQHPDDLGRPVAHARAQGELFLDKIRETVHPLTTSVERLIEALDGMTDPEAVAEQLTTTTKEHQAQMAVLDARVNTAERDRRELRERLTEADAEAEDSTTKLHVAMWLYAEKEYELSVSAWLHAEAQWHSGQATARAQEAEHAVRQAQTDNAQLTGELDATRRRVGELEEKTAEMAGQLQIAQQRTAELDAHLAEQTTRAEQSEILARWLIAEAQQEKRAQIDQVHREAATEIAQARRGADARAEAAQAAERAAAVSEQAAADARREYDQLAAAHATQIASLTQALETTQTALSLLTSRDDKGSGTSDQP